MSIVSCLLVNLVHSTQYTLAYTYKIKKCLTFSLIMIDWLDWIGLDWIDGNVVAGNYCNGEWVSEWVSEILKFHILIFFLWRFFTLPRPFLFFFCFVFFFRVFLPFFFFLLSLPILYLVFFFFFFFFFFSRLKSSIDFPA